MYTYIIYTTVSSVDGLVPYSPSHRAEKKKENTPSKLPDQKQVCTYLPICINTNICPEWYRNRDHYSLGNHENYYT